MHPGRRPSGLSLVSAMVERSWSVVTGAVHRQSAGKALSWSLFDLISSSNMKAWRSQQVSRLADAESVCPTCGQAIPGRTLLALHLDEPSATERDRSARDKTYAKSSRSRTLQKHSGRALLGQSPGAAPGSGDEPESEGLRFHHESSLRHGAVLTQPVPNVKPVASKVV